MADRPGLVRVSPERQRLPAEATFRNESGLDVHVDRVEEKISASAELAEAFGLSADSLITHVVTRITEDGKPVSISDTYQPLDVVDISAATQLDELIEDRLPSPAHAAWLRTSHGGLIKAVHQRFSDDDGRLIMQSDVSYPRDRYSAFLFRMTLKAEHVQADDSE